MAIKWYGNQAMKALQKNARVKVLKAAVVTEAAIKLSMRAGGRTASGQLAGEEYTTQTGKTRKRRVDPMTGAKAKKVGSYRSKPGEVPRVQTGTLRRSYTHEVHPVLPISRVGTNLKYAKVLEWGSRNMAPRPHVRPALKKLMPVYKKLFAVPMVGRGGL